MGHEALFVISPKQIVQRVGTLGGIGADHRAPAALQRFFQHARQHIFQRTTLQMIEESFRHPS